MLRYLRVAALSLLPVTASCAEVLELSASDVDFAVCQIDLRKDALAMYWKSPTGQVYGSLDMLDASLRKEGKKVICGTNGGIFDKKQKPLGLYIEHGAQMHPLNLRRQAYGNFYLQPNGVFVVYRGRAEVVTTDVYLEKPDAEKRLIAFANQSGPILLQDGQLNPLFSRSSTNTTLRNAVCVRSPVSVLLVTARNPITFYDFAHVLKDRFACQSALYLDGTLSTFFPSRRTAYEQPLGVLIAVTGP